MFYKYDDVHTTIFFAIFPYLSHIWRFTTNDDLYNVDIDHFFPECIPYIIVLFSLNVDKRRCTRYQITGCQIRFAGILLYSVVQPGHPKTKIKALTMIEGLSEPSPRGTEAAERR